MKALAERDWDRLRPLLHPYLHFSPDGAKSTVGGRAKVLELLEDDPDVSRPANPELRDGQIYRWR